MKKSFLFITLVNSFLLVLPMVSLAQPHIQNIIDFEGRDFIQHSIVAYPGDTYVIAGTISPAPIAGDSDILLMMVDNQGNIIWSQFIDYSDLGNDYIYDDFVGSVFVDRDENIVITGYTKLNPSGNLNPVYPVFFINLMIAKFDGDGNLIGDIVLNEMSLPTKWFIHGFDIDETNDENYIVAGLCATEGYAIDTPKFAFVLSIDKHLEQPPNWINIYESTSVDPAHWDVYNSFNHILRVEDYPEYEEVFLISGGAAFDAPVDHTVLIDSQGNQLWSFTFGLNNSSPLSGIVSALYDPSQNEFYVVSHARQSSDLIYILVLDGNTGFIKDGWTVQNVEGNPRYNHLYINDMQWANNQEWGDSDSDDGFTTSIVFSGYSLNLDTDLGNPILFSIDVHTKSVNWANKYHFEFDIIDYQNLFGFNEIIQPIHSSSTPHYSGFFQHFYRPKSLLRSYLDTSSWEGFQFSSVFQPRGSGTEFGLSFYNTDLDGRLGGDCFSDLSLSIQTVNSTNGFSIDPSQITWDRIPLTLQVYQEGFEPFLSCKEESKNSQIEGGVFQNDKIYIYPNPTENLVHIKYEGSIEKIMVYNLFGQIIEVSSTDNTLDFSALSSGVYLIEIKKGGNTETFRVIKK